MRASCEALRVGTPCGFITRNQGGRFEACPVTAFVILYLYIKACDGTIPLTMTQPATPCMGCVPGPSECFIMYICVHY